MAVNRWLKVKDLMNVNQTQTQTQLHKYSNHHF